MACSISMPIPARSLVRHCLDRRCHCQCRRRAANARRSPHRRQPNSAQPLRLPEAPQVFGTAMPSVVKATAIVNGDVITQTDIDQRLALLAIANGGQIPAEELERLRQQVLRNLIDETLQIQAAKRRGDRDQADGHRPRRSQRVSANVKQTPEQLDAYLAANGSSIDTRCAARSRARSPGSGCSAPRSKAASASATTRSMPCSTRMNASKGTAGISRRRNLPVRRPRQPGRRRSTTPTGSSSSCATARPLPAMRGNIPRPRPPRSAAISAGSAPSSCPRRSRSVLRQMEPGTVSNPIPVPGGVSIIAVQDTRKILTAGPARRGAQPQAGFDQLPQGHDPRQQAEPIVARFAEAARNVGGCGGAEQIAAEFQRRGRAAATRSRCATFRRRFSR